MSPRSGARGEHSGFELSAPFLGWSLVLALAVGFTLAAHLVILPPSWLAGPRRLMVIQLHGHVQLYGWVGLFVLGVGTFYLPRLRGSPLRWPRGVRAAAWLLGGGMALVAVGEHLWLFEIRAWAPLTLLGALLELTGLATVAAALAATFAAGPPVSGRRGLASVLPWLGLGLASMAVSQAGVLLELLAAVAAGSPVIAGWWHPRLVDLGMLGFALPVVVAVSARNLPLYLSLAPLGHRALWGLAGPYALGLLLLILGAGRLRELGSLLLFGSLLVLVPAQGVLWRWRQPAWLAGRSELRDTSGRTTRGRLPDRGQYGRFEIPVRSAYVWLLVAALLAVVRAGSVLAGGQPGIGWDAVRHALTVGTFSLLIMGMAPRMVPAFAGREVAWRGLVSWMALLGNVAAAGRVLPLVVHAEHPLLAWAWAASGPLGWLAVLLLAVLLWASLRRLRPRPGEGSG